MKLRSLVLWAALAAAAPGLVACQSTRSWRSCPDIYSGVRYFRDQYPALPFDGRVFFSFDLPLTAVMDTLALPFTAFASPVEPAGGFPIGCRWARGRARADQGE